MDNLVNSNIGRYHIVEQLGQGGMATVYKAYDTRLDRDVAIKVIRTELFGNAIIERILKRFEREAKALARLDHPNIIKVHDYGEYNGAPYLVMQYVRAGTLKERTGQPMPWKQAVQIILPVARALAYAHNEGILHRDVKPSNILVTSQNEPILSDFGIAKILEDEEGQTLTGTGVGVGTPEYMAPEQGLGKDVDGRADVYALGVVLYELLTGRKPYTADTPMAVLLKQANDPLPRPRDFVSDLPDEVEKVLIKALAKQPEDRYADMVAFAQALEKMLPSSAFKRDNLQIFKEVFYPVEKRESIVVKPEKREKKPFTSIKNQLPVGAGLLALATVIIFWMSGKFPTKSMQLPPTDIVLETLTEAATLVPTLTETLAPTATSTSAPTKTPTPSPTPIIQISKRDEMEMVFVPEDEFIMGNDDGNFNEKPAHAVYLDDYWIDRYEVTNIQYAKCVRAGGCNKPFFPEIGEVRDMFHDPVYENYPVVWVSWAEAWKYCRWAGRRLPSEAEWEKAARGTDGRVFPWGNEEPSSFVVNVTGELQPSNSFMAGTSPFGAVNMAGNVSEWVADWYQDDYYSISPFENPSGPSSGLYRVLRGGSYYSSYDKEHSLFREWGNPKVYSSSVGFRCASDEPAQ